MAWATLWDNLLLWVPLHPGATYLLFLIVSLGESLALVGLLVPGTAIMVGIGRRNIGEHDSADRHCRVQSWAMASATGWAATTIRN